MEFACNVCGKADGVDRFLLSNTGWPTGNYHESCLTKENHEKLCSHENSLS